MKYYDIESNSEFLSEIEASIHQTTKRLFLHINTVRNRIEEINDLIDINLDNPIDRLKLELLLKLLNNI